jgi:hypothetical protein
MRRFLLTVATAATALVGAACTDSIGIGAGVAGTYELRTINGVTLPVTDGGIIIEAGQLELESNGDFVDILQYRSSSGGLITTDEQFGTWERSGDEILLDYEESGTVRAERTSSSRLRIEDGFGNVWVYQRF